MVQRAFTFWLLCSRERSVQIWSSRPSPSYVFVSTQLLHPGQQPSLGSYFEGDFSVFILPS